MFCVTAPGPHSYAGLKRARVTRSLSPSELMFPLRKGPTAKVVKNLIRCLPEGLRGGKDCCVPLGFNLFCEEDQQLTQAA